MNAADSDGTTGSTVASSASPNFCRMYLSAQSGPDLVSGVISVVWLYGFRCSVLALRQDVPHPQEILTPLGTGTSLSTKSLADPA